jgi:hypothetical protein
MEPLAASSRYQLLAALVGLLCLTVNVGAPNARVVILGIIDVRMKSCVNRISPLRASRSGTLRRPAPRTLTARE